MFSLMNLASVILKRNQENEIASDMLKEAIKLSDRMKHIIAQGMMRYNYSNLLLSEGNQKMATSFLREIIAISEPNGFVFPALMAKNVLDKIQMEN